MLTILLTILIILPVTAGYGNLLAGLLKDQLPSSQKMLLGIVLLSGIWCSLAFFFPINFWVEFSTIAVGLFLYLRDFLRNRLYEKLQRDPLLYACVLLAVFLGSFPPFILDHFGYFIPTVRWLSEFGLTLGVSNLDLVLGQTSFWHIFQAGFSHIADVSLRLNVVLITIYILYIFEKKKWIHLIFLPFLFLFIQSPTPDLPAFVISLIVLQELLSRRFSYIFVILLSAFVFAVKPTTVCLPLAVMLIGISTKKPLQLWLYAVPVLFLYFFKNTWTFGYPVFPLAFPDVAFEWKPNPEILQNSAKLAVEKTFDEQFTASQIRQFTVWQWFSNWLTLPGIKGIINIIFLILLGCVLIFASIKKQRKIWLIVIALIIKSLLIIWFSAQYRFFLDVFFAVLLLIFHDKFRVRLALLKFSFLTFILILFFTKPGLLQKAVPSFRVGEFIGHKFKSSQFIEPAEYHYTHYSTFKIGNLTFHVTKGYPFTFTTPLPAISPGFLLECEAAGIIPQKMKDKGFYWRNLTVAEKTQLKRIIRDLKLVQDSRDD